MVASAVSACALVLVTAATLAGLFTLAEKPAKPGYGREPPDYSGGITVRVHYIRHGESYWNSAQAAARASGESEEAVRALGKTERFTDAPLSGKGVEQATALSDRLFAPTRRMSDTARELAEAQDLGPRLACAAAKTCTPPVVYTSNLRRAIDTALLGLRPMLEADAAGAVHVIPALQETCHYTDCNPLRLDEAHLDAGAAIRAPLESSHEYYTRLDAVNLTTAAEFAGAATSDDEREGAIQALHGKTLDATLGSEAGDYVRAAYTSSRLASQDVDKSARLVVYEQLHEADQTPMYNDTRRIPDDVKLSSLLEISDFQLKAAASPIAERLSVLMQQLLPASGIATSEGVLPSSGDVPSTTPIVIAGHSRFLREMLFAFSANSTRHTRACASGTASGGGVGVLHPRVRAQAGSPTYCGCAFESPASSQGSIW